MGVEAGLGRVDGAVVDGAELELEVAPVVGVQLDLDVDRLVGSGLKRKDFFMSKAFDILVIEVRCTFPW